MTAFKRYAPQEEPYVGPTIGELIVRAIRRFADRVALASNGTTITYREMGARISQYMQVLAKLGFGHHTGMCALAPNCSEIIILRFAATLLGARFTQLHPLGSVYDHIYTIKDSQSKAVILHADFAHFADDITAQVPDCEIFILGTGDIGTDLRALALAETAEIPQCRADPLGIAYMPYTGGTTGKPKGIMQTHRTLVTMLMMCLSDWEWMAEPRFLAITPLSHASGMLLLPVFMRGGTVYLQDGFNVEAFLQSVRCERITTVFMVPTMIYALLDHELTRQTDLSSLKMLVYGGAPITPVRLRQALDVFGPVFLQLYAQAEAPMTVTTLNTWDHDPSRPERLASCGYPMAGAKVALLDADGQPVACGGVGEICVRGDIVMAGYWNRPDETAAAFRGGWLHTGDMARADEDGFLYIVDRAKDMIISGGFNVYPKEVEDVLAEHPAVSQSAVISVPDEKWGEAVKALVVVRPECAVSAEELMALVKRRKGPVQTPKTIDFLDALPLTPVGKPDKKALRAKYWTGVERNVH